MNQKKSVTSWDISFFKDFISLRNRLYASYPDFINESLEDLEIYFGSQSYFSKKMDWTATVVEKAGRYLLSMNPKTDLLHLGYFECDGNAELLHASLLEDITEYRAKYPKIKSVIGPVQGTLYAGYRFREATLAPRFLGESLHLESYPDLWEKWGFQRGESWDSYTFNPTVGFNFYTDVEKKLEKLWRDPKIKVRSLDFSHWDQEIEKVFEITMDAYGLTDTNDEIDSVTFKKISEKIKPLLSPKHVKMLDYDNQTVAFTICYPDIQDSIRNFNLRAKRLPAWLNKIRLVIDIKLKKHPLLIVYVAKRKSCPIKWATVKLGCAVSTSVTPSDHQYMVSTFNAEASGSRSSLPTPKTFHSRHFLMKLPLS